MEIVRITVEMFPGAVYWGSVSYETFGEGESFITEHHRTWLGEYDEYFETGINEAAATSPCGVFERESGEHGEIWFPRPEGADFVSASRSLGVLYHREGAFSAYLVPSMAFFFGSTGRVAPLSTEAIETALLQMVPLGRFPSRDEAVAAVTQANWHFE
jgi:hypothetical protein